MFARRAHKLEEELMLRFEPSSMYYSIGSFSSMLCFSVFSYLLEHSHRLHECLTIFVVLSSLSQHAELEYIRHSSYTCIPQTSSLIL